MRTLLNVTNKLVYKLKKMINYNIVTNEFLKIDTNNFDSICKVLIDNKIIGKLLTSLFDEIIKYKSEINVYIKNSESFSKELVNIF